MGEVTVGLLHEEDVEELPFRPPHGEVVLCAPFPLELAGMCVEGTCHPEMIQGDVAQGYVLFELGRPRDPLTETLGQDQVVIGVSDEGTHRVRGVRGGRTLGSGGDDWLTHM